MQPNITYLPIQKFSKNQTQDTKALALLRKCFFGSPSWTRTNDAYGQKHGRLARLERFVILSVSSCSALAFICRRQRQAPSQLPAAMRLLCRGVGERTTQG